MAPIRHRCTTTVLRRNAVDATILATRIVVRVTVRVTILVDEMVRHRLTATAAVRE
jgi:hypothetical protein